MIRSVLTVLLGLTAAGELFAADSKPNVVLIMADDFGYECVTANGGESYDTPQLDKLAAGGVRFEHCYVQPVCTPTRMQLMTGLSNARNYFTFGTMGRDQQTFAHLLKEAGYATGIAGKWQLGREKDSPQHFGFDEAYLWQHTRRPPRYTNPGLEYNGEERDFANGEYGPDIINDFALDFIASHKEGPFFLYYPMLLTHGPFQPTPDSADWDPTLIGEKTKNNRKYFADDVKYADKLVGKVIAKLDELGIRDNTLVLFLGDNGTGGGVVSQFQGQAYQGGKGKTNAHGTRVPFIANWPGHIKERQIDSHLVSSTDFLPTLCELAGASIPPATSADGQSFLPRLLGQQTKPRETLYSWFGRGLYLQNVSEFAMTTEHKLYRTGEFFDLMTDPEEKSPRQVADLAGEDAAIAAKLTAVLDQYKDARPAEIIEATKVAETKKANRQKQRRANRKQRQASSEIQS